jgi:hypothetical protein
VTKQACGTACAQLWRWHAAHPPYPVRPPLSLSTSISIPSRGLLTPRSETDSQRGDGRPTTAPSFQHSPIRVTASYSTIPPCANLPSLMQRLPSAGVRRRFARAPQLRSTLVFALPFMQRLAQNHQWRAPKTAAPIAQRVARRGQAGCATHPPVYFRRRGGATYPPSHSWSRSWPSEPLTSLWRFKRGAARRG